MNNIYRFPWGEDENAQVAIVHFGSKSTPLIAQILREIGLKSKIFFKPEELSLRVLKGYRPRVVILSGGPHTCYEPGAPSIPKDTLDELRTKNKTVILGICYGAQLLAHMYGGKVARAAQRETWKRQLTLNGGNFFGYSGGKVVMNHQDEVICLPAGWKSLGSTEKCKHAFFCLENSIFGTIFHPEMDHTENGEVLMHEIVCKIAGCYHDYHFTPEGFTEQACDYFRSKVGADHKLIVAFSGGVDSAVARQLAIRALGEDRVVSVFVDTGCLTEDEPAEVKKYFGERNIIYVDAHQEFFKALERIVHKGDDGLYYRALRLVMGSKFIDVLEREADVIPGEKMLAQGTNYADIIESLTRLTYHHNVGGLPEKMNLAIVEILAGLYKSEIRKIAEYLDLPYEVVWKQPLPGPENAVRMWGPVTREKLRVAARANRILKEVVIKHYPRHEDRPCEYYAALVPLLIRGIVGDEGVDGYQWLIVAFSSDKRESYATAEAFKFTREFDEEISHRLTSETELNGHPFLSVSVNITGKPPRNIEPH